MLDTPVALIIFRRPALTERVVAAISRVRPTRLFVIADGPRPERPDDAAACAAARAVIDRVDWDCEVERNFSEVNLGCGRRPASGISWLFDHVEEAIILEDDCVPDPSFFRYCAEMLQRYRDDERVMHIAGSTYRTQPAPTPYSYYFSHFNGAWGWATWRRAWRHFDPAVRLWHDLRQTSWLADIVEDEAAVRYWAAEFERAYDRSGDVSYWDHQWTFACWAHSGLSIVPRANLVSNIGCGPDATHTLLEDDPLGNVPAAEIEFPLRHPPNVLVSREADREFLRTVVLPRLGVPSPVRRAMSRIAPRCVKDGYHRLAALVREGRQTILAGR